MRDDISLCIFKFRYNKTFRIVRLFWIVLQMHFIFKHKMIQITHKNSTKQYERKAHQSPPYLFPLTCTYTPCTKYWPMPSEKNSRLYDIKPCFNYHVTLTFPQIIQLYKKYTNQKTVKQRCKGKAISVQALRAPGDYGSQISCQSAHEGNKVLSPTQRPLSCLQEETPLVLISATGWVNPRVIVRPGLCQWKIPMTPSGNELMTYPFVVQCLNKLCHGMPQPIIWAAQ